MGCLLLLWDLIVNQVPEVKSSSKHGHYLLGGSMSSENITCLRYIKTDSSTVKSHNMLKKEKEKTF